MGGFLTLVNTIHLVLLVTYGSSQMMQGEECHERLSDVDRICGAGCVQDQDCRASYECRCDGECGKTCVNPYQRCEPEPYIENGKVIMKTKNMFSAMVQYKCNDRYRLDGLSARVCQGNGRWKGEDPKCVRMHHRYGQIKQCGPQPIAENAELKGGAPRTPNSKVGTKLWYECLPGFTKHEKSIDQAWCVRGPKWIGPDMDCITQGCSTPRDIDHGHVETSAITRVGSKILYRCHKGYFLVGPRERTCTEAGTWDRTEPSCQKVACGPPPTVDHAQHDGARDQIKFLTSTQLTYTCNDGYFREGSQRAICKGPNGEWVGPTMSCRARDCGAPGDIPNGRRDEGYRFTYPTRITYYCNEGYELRGNPIRQCKANGEWSGAAPSCVAIQCGDLAPPLHGTKIGSEVTFGTELNFVCNEGYKLVGSSVRKCLADGSWNGQAVSCIEVNCGSPGPLYNGYLDGHRTTVGALYFFRCHLRNELVGEGAEAKCLENGQWSIPTPTCYSQCKVPEITNGTVVGAYAGVYVNHPTVINLKCFNGLVLNDSRPVVCQNGTWSILPKCIPAPCYNSPPQIANGHRVFFSLSNGARSRYFCFAGYALENKSHQFLNCEFGKWVGTRPTCKEQYCKHPGKLKNGRILKIGVKGMFPFESYITFIRHGERLLYECNRNHRLSGPRGAACVNGKWSPKEPPVCLRSRHPVFNKLWRPLEENFRHPQYY